MLVILLRVSAREEVVGVQLVDGVVREMLELVILVITIGFLIRLSCQSHETVVEKVDEKRIAA